MLPGQSTEELRPVTFRVVLLDPSNCPPMRVLLGLPSNPLQRSPPPAAQRFTSSSPAVEFNHSLLGIQDGPEGFQIWGIVHSGPRWINSFYSSRKPFQALPSCLIISVTGPGSMSVSNGSLVVA